MDLSVGGTAVKWASPESFYPNNEQVWAGLATQGRSLALTRSYGPEMCKHSFFGGGISAVVKACGDQTTTVRVRAVRLKEGTRPLLVSYTAIPNFDGQAAPPPSGDPETGPVPLMHPITGLPGF